MSNNPYNRRFPSIYRGVVEDNNDPEKLGRCRVRVPSVHGQLSYPLELLPWARPVVLSPVRKGRGVVNIPDIGDIVWVFFEGAVKEFPIYLGGTYATGEIDIDINKVDIHIDEENKITYDRLNKSYDIKSGDNHIIMTSSGISIIGNTTIVGDLAVEGDISRNTKN